MVYISVLSFFFTKRSFFEYFYLSIPQTHLAEWCTKELLQTPKFELGSGAELKRRRNQLGYRPVNYQLLLEKLWASKLKNKWTMCVWYASRLGKPATVKYTAVRETLGIMWAQLRVLLKHIEHHNTMVSKGLRGALNFLPHYAERC